MSKRYRDDRVPEPPRARERQNEYYLPMEGISREVIQADICRYLGNDALVRVGEYNGRRGYIIKAYRNLTSEMIADLKADSARWENERFTAESKGYSSVPYGNSQTHSDRQTFGPSNSPLPQGGIVPPPREMRDPRDLAMRDVTMRDPRDAREPPLYAQPYPPHNTAPMDFTSSGPTNYVPPPPPQNQQFPVGGGYPPQGQYAYSQAPAPYPQVAPSRGPTDSPTQQESMQMYTTSSALPRQGDYMNPSTHSQLQPRYAPGLDSNNSPQQAYTEAPPDQMYYSSTSAPPVYPVMATSYTAPSAFPPEGGAGSSLQNARYPSPYARTSPPLAPGSIAHAPANGSMGNGSLAAGFY